MIIASITRSASIVDRDFYLCFWHKLDRYSAPPYTSGVAALPAKSLDLGNRNAWTPTSPTALRNVFELEWLDDRCDQFMI